MFEEKLELGGKASRQKWNLGQLFRLTSQSKFLFSSIADNHVACLASDENTKTKCSLGNRKTLLSIENQWITSVILIVYCAFLVNF